MAHGAGGGLEPGAQSFQPAGRPAAGRDCASADVCRGRRLRDVVGSPRPRMASASPLSAPGTWQTRFVPRRHGAAAHRWPCRRPARCRRRQCPGRRWCALRRSSCRGRPMRASPRCTVPARTFASRVTRLVAVSASTVAGTASLVTGSQRLSWSMPTASRFASTARTSPICSGPSAAAAAALVSSLPSSTCFRCRRSLLALSSFRPSKRATFFAAGSRGPASCPRR